MDAEEWALPVGVVALLGVLFFLQVPLWGFGPLWLKKVWTRIIRFFKGGDVRRWNWTQIEPGLYVGSLPRTLDDLTELQQAPHNLGGVVSLVEPWEVKVDADALRQLDIQWLLLPTPDYSAPKMQDVENSVAFIDRQVYICACALPCMRAAALSCVVFLAHADPVCVLVVCVYVCMCCVNAACKRKRRAGALQRG